MSVFEIVQGVEGCCLILDDERIAGPKPWGGGRVVKSWTTRKEYGELVNRICEPIESGRCLHGTDCPAWLCSECGKLFESGANFCSNCGAKVVKS